jgi:hypothetical protein
MYIQLGYTPMKIARIYLRVTTDKQDLTRQQTSSKAPARLAIT